MNSVVVRKPRFNFTEMALKTIASLIERRGATVTQRYLAKRGVRFAVNEKARKLNVSLPTLSVIAVKMGVFSPSLRGRPRLNRNSG